MSYARTNGVDSDVYVVRSSDVWNCYHGSSSRFGYGREIMHSLADLWDHLLDHVEIGDMVPQRTWDRISMEMENAT